MLVKRSGVTDTEPQGEPVAQLMIDPTEDGGSAVAASFYENSGSTYLCRLQDGDTFLISASAVEGFLKQVDNYLAGKRSSFPCRDLHPKPVSACGGTRRTAEGTANHFVSCFRLALSVPARAALS